MFEKLIEGSWISYLFVIIITSLIVAIITENAVISRIQLSDNVVFANGRCRSIQTPIASNQPSIASNQPSNSQINLESIQNDLNFIKSKLS